MPQENESRRAKALGAHEVSSLAAYIGEMSAGLAAMARRSKMPMLAYFLDLARLEAETCSTEPTQRPKNTATPNKRAKAA
jgi:hypothetical protein